VLISFMFKLFSFIFCSSTLPLLPVSKSMLFFGICINDENPHSDVHPLLDEQDMLSKIVCSFIFSIFSKFFP
jgi:hypothetical protein